VDHVVVDVEIARTVEEAGGWDRTDAMGVGVAGLYEFAGDRFRLYGPADVAALVERLERADRISGYNLIAFDLPVILGLPRGDVTPQLARLVAKSDDLLARVYAALGFREKGWKVQDVAQATLGRGKAGDGADAPLLFQRGAFAALHTYVLDDVTLERDLAAFADRHGFLYNGCRTVRLPPWKPLTPPPAAASA